MRAPNAVLHASRVTAAVLLATVIGLADPSLAQPLTPQRKLSLKSSRNSSKSNMVSDTGNTRGGKVPRLIGDCV